MTSLAMWDYRLGGWPQTPMDQRIESFLADVRALADLLDGFVLTVLIVVAIGTIYYAIRLVKELIIDHWCVISGGADRMGRSRAAACCAAPALAEELQRRRGTRLAEHLKLVLSIIDRQGP